MATIERARALLTDQDVFNARLLARKAFNDARLAEREHLRLTAGHELVQRARQLQGDALLIEVRCKILIADEWDKLQAAGKAATRGKKPADGNVSHENVFTAEQAGLTRGEIHEARKLRDAEVKEPGLAERAIQTMVESRLKLSNRGLSAQIGTKTATKEERGDNFYETPREALEALLAVERFDRAALGLEDGDPDPIILEPACGRGAISTVLEEHGFDVAICDLRDRGVVTRHGECQQVADFFDTRRGAPFAPLASNVIITNPPYGEAMDRFIRHALEAHVPRKMALLVNLNVLSGFENADRRFWREALPPTRAHVLIRRLPMMHRDGWDGPVASSQMNTMWLVWDAAAPDATADKPWGQTTTLHYLDWKERAHVGDSPRKTSDQGQGWQP